jgi:arginine decarboxylase
VHDASADAMLFVDEAWGGHLHFHPELPPSAMDAGADIAVQSTHKLAGGLQQTGLIHWQEARVDSELMEEAFREYVTTSPSYHLLASADAAVRSLAATGRDALGTCIARTRAFKALLRERLPRVHHLDDPAWVGRHYAHVAGCDKVKTTVALSGYALSGFAVAEALVERGIVVEKAGVNTITFITTFQLEEAAIEATVAALEEILHGRELPDGDDKRMPANPFRAIDDRPVMHPYHARRYAKSIGQEVPLDQAVGRVAAEEVEVYPPGIPVILEGFRVSEDAVGDLREARDLGGAIVARDTSLATLRVL